MLFNRKLKYIYYGKFYRLCKTCCFFLFFGSFCLTDLFSIEQVKAVWGFVWRKEYILKIGFLNWDLNECRFYFWVPNVKMRWPWVLASFGRFLRLNLPAFQIYPSFVLYLRPFLWPYNFLLNWGLWEQLSKFESTSDGFSNDINFVLIERFLIEVRAIQKSKKKWKQKCWRRVRSGDHNSNLFQFTKNKNKFNKIKPKRRPIFK